MTPSTTRTQRSASPRSRTARGRTAAPRRVSGPSAGGRVPLARTAGGAAVARAVAAPAYAPPRRPRLAPAPHRLGASSLPARALRGLRDLPDHRLLDRAIRGRAWIIALGVALMGIVFMQVSLLELNAGISRSVERSAALERQNSALTASVSRLSSGERIQAVAGRLGLVLPDAGRVNYTKAATQRDARKAAKVMRAPDPVTTLAAGTAAGTATATGPVGLDPVIAPETTAPATTTTTTTTTPAPAGGPTTTTTSDPTGGTAPTGTADPAAAATTP